MIPAKIRDNTDDDIDCHYGKKHHSNIYVVDISGIFGNLSILTPRHLLPVLNLKFSEYKPRIAAAYKNSLIKYSSK